MSLTLRDGHRDGRNNLTVLFAWLPRSDQCDFSSSIDTCIGKDAPDLIKLATVVRSHDVRLQFEFQKTICSVSGSGHERVGQCTFTDVESLKQTFFDSVPRRG